ncbi:MAG: ROK family protein [Rhodospirillaceae bacterium]
MRIGVDMGGTKIEGIVLDTRGREVARHRVPTPAGDYDGTVATVRDLVGRLAAESVAGPETTVGVGIPGTVSPATGLVKNANSTCLIGRPLDRDLADAVGRPLRLANDANCFAVSEAVDGAGAGHRVVFGVILGTGVGAGISVDGAPLVGPNAIAGEWGHNPLPWPKVLDGRDERPGEACYCGQRGCIETFLSGPGLSQDHADHTGATASPEDIDDDATWRRYEHRLARSLAAVINVLDPDVIVLGGGLSNVGRLYANVPAIWNRWIFSDECTTPLVANRHGNSSGVRGAAWLWPAAGDAR